MDHPSGSAHHIRFFDYYDSYGTKFRACITLVPIMMPQIDSRYCVASPTKRRAFCILSPIIPDLPGLTNGQFYMVIRRKKEKTVDGLVPDIDHEYVYEKKVKAVLPSTIRCFQEQRLGDEDVPCYDIVNFKLLKKQGIIRVLKKVFRNKMLKIVRVEMLLKPYEMIRWCDGCARVEDIKNINMGARFTLCKGCCEYQKYYICSKSCKKAASKKFDPHDDVCGDWGRTIKVYARGDFFRLEDEKSQPKEDLSRLLLPSYYYGIVPFEILSYYWSL